jgi:hypothetical protein
MFTTSGSYFGRLDSSTTFRQLFGIAVVLVVVICAVTMTRRLLYFRHLSKRAVCYLGLKPGLTTIKTALATEQLLAVIHGMDDSRSLTNRLLGRRTVLSLEVLSSKEEGIRFVVCIAKADRLLFEPTINSYLPEVRIEELDGNSFTVPHQRKLIQLLHFRQTRHFAYPLRAQKLLDQHDPIDYLTGGMTKLKAGELIAFQLVLSPAPSRLNKRITRKLNSRQGATKTLHRSWLVITLIRFILGICLLPIRLIMILLSGWLHGHKGETRRSMSPIVSTRSQAQQSLVASINEKLEQPLFYVTIKALVIAQTKAAAIEKRRGLRMAMTSYRMAKSQALTDSHRFFGRQTYRLQVILFKFRIPTLSERRSTILSSAEIAAIYHFPDGESTKTENIAKSLSRNLSAPISLKPSPHLDVGLGFNSYHGERIEIGLTESERGRHVYVVGGTGNGKTTMLLGSIVQDMKSGKGLAVIDPHGDLAESVLHHVPESRLDDVVYFNPDDLDYPMGLNLLEIPPNLSRTELLRERDLVGESVISIFRKLFSEDDSGRHRVEYIFRNAIQTALTIPDATLFTVYDLLNDPVYQKTIVRGLSDNNLRNFWLHEFGRAGDYQRVKMASGVTSKIGRFLFSASARQILEQPHSTIDFDDILASGKILICNVSKGRLGEDTSTLFGTTLLARLQIATLRRAPMSETERRPFYVYVDEFQNFATTSFVQMLSEAGKYKLFLTMAEQATSRQEQQRMVQIILANACTLICFRTGTLADEELLLPAFKPFLAPGELANLPAYSFYMRHSALGPHEPLAGQTQMLQDKGSEDIYERVIKVSREQYVIPTSIINESEDVNGATNDVMPSLKSKPGTVYQVPLAK